MAAGDQHSTCLRTGLRAGGGEREDTGGLQKDGLPRPFPLSGCADGVADGTNTMAGIQAGCQVCFTRTMGQAPNSSAVEKWDGVSGDVLHSVMENRPNLPVIPSDEMTQLQNQKGKPHRLPVLICELWKGSHCSVDPPTGNFLQLPHP